MSIEQNGEPGENSITPILGDSNPMPIQAELSAEEIRIEVARREDEKDQRLSDLARHKVERKLQELPSEEGVDRFDQICLLVSQEQIDHYKAETSAPDSIVRSELIDGYRRRLHVYRTALRAELKQLEAAEPGASARKYGELIGRQLQRRWHPGSRDSDLIYSRYSGLASFEDEGEALLLSTTYDQLGTQGVYELVASVARTSTEQLNLDWESKERQTQPDLPGNLQLSRIEDDQQYKNIAAELKAKEISCGLSDLSNRIVKVTIYRLAQDESTIHDPVYEEELGHLSVLEESRARLEAELRAWLRLEVKPILLERQKEAAALIHLPEESDSKPLIPNPKTPDEELTQEVDLDRVIKSNDFLSWDGSSLPGVMKQAHGKGLMDSRDYIVELAATMLTGEYVYRGSQGTNNINLNRYNLPNGKIVYTVGLGQHRTAALKLLGRRFVPANIT